MNQILSRLFTGKALIVFFLLFTSFPTHGIEAAITLAWDPPGANMDGSTVTDLAGYKIYYDTDGSGTPYHGTGLTNGASPIKVPLTSFSDPSRPEMVLDGMQAGVTYSIVVTAYDKSNNESGYSNVVTAADNDSDTDGLSDSLERSYGLDPISADSDGDGIGDATEFGPFETPLDSDGDGTIDALDLDSDNDGIADASEGTGDKDNDGAPNYRDSDDGDLPTSDPDGDGISNIDETTYGLNPNLLDSDQDNISDEAEWGSSNTPADTDGDGLVDALDPDSDNDGTSDKDEDRVDSDQDGIPDRLDNKVATMATDHGKMSIVVNHIKARLSQTEFIKKLTTGSNLPPVDFPYGGVEYEVSGISVGELVLVTIIMNKDLPENAQYWKYDEDNGFQKLESQVSGKEITFPLTDGGDEDADKMRNGVIVDPGFVGIPQSASVADPTSTPVSSGGGGSGCSLSKGSGNPADIFWFILPLLLVALYKRKRVKSR